jgi:hypothetical protein
MLDENTKKSIDRRSNYLLKCLNVKPDTTLLFYIEKIQIYGEKDCYFDKNILDKYNCNFLILIPLLNLNTDPFIYYKDLRITIIYFESNLEGYATETTSHIEEWNKIHIIINNLYNFNIEEKNDE